VPAVAKAITTRLGANDKHASVVPRKYLDAGKLSFSACLAENPGALKIENPRFYA